MRKREVLGLWVAALVMIITMVHYDRASNRAQIQSKKDYSMRLLSKDFEHNSSIPSRFTCDGENISPRLSWDAVPEGTVSFALIVDDPDAPDPKAPQRTWVHWVVYNMPLAKRTLEAGEIIPDSQLGASDFKSKKFGGPCPPIGEHRYFFKLYALDTVLDLQPGATKAIVEKAMKGHVLASAELVGLYQKK